MDIKLLYGEALEVAAEALKLLAQRHAMIVSDLDNAHSPGYKAFDLMVGKSIQQQRRSGYHLAFKAFHQCHLPSARTRDLGITPKIVCQPEDSNLRGDGKTIDMDREMSNSSIACLAGRSKYPDCFQASTGHGPARRIITHHQHQPFSNNPAVTFIQRQDAGCDGSFYVANRNSDIFHKNDFKSFQRINTDNMIEFKDPSETMGRQFKPYRMCCSEMISPKRIDRLARGYAGHRYCQQ